MTGTRAGNHRICTAEFPWCCGVGAAVTRRNSRRERVTVAPSRAASLRPPSAQRVSQLQSRAVSQRAVSPERYRRCSDCSDHTDTFHLTPRGSRSHYRVGRYVMVPDHHADELLVIFFSSTEQNVFRNETKLLHCREKNQIY